MQAAAFFVASATAVVIVFPQHARKATGRSALSELVEGLRCAVTNRNTRVLLAAGIMPFFLLVPLFAGMLPLYAKDVYRSGPEVLGMLMTATRSRRNRAQIAEELASAK